MARRGGMARGAARQKVAQRQARTFLANDVQPLLPRNVQEVSIGIQEAFDCKIIPAAEHTNLQQTNKTTITAYASFKVTDLVASD